MNYEYELKDISCFVQVARAGSLSRASNIYNIPKASLSHHLRKLEDALQVQLFIRKAKGLELTEAGKKYLELCSAIFESCDSAANAAQWAHTAVGGTIRLAATSEFGTSVIGAAALHFSRSYPDVHFDIQLCSVEKIITGQVDFDCLIYVGESPDSPLMRRKLGDFTYGLYASPAYLSSVPKTQDLKAVERLSGIIYMRNNTPERWVLDKQKTRQICSPETKYTVNDYWMSKYFCVKGMGVSYLPDFFVKYEVESKALVPILPDWRSRAVPVFIIYSPQKHRIARIAKLVDILCENFEGFTMLPGYSLVSREE
ncbi:LysR family transcriptional regulator [Methylorubrum populi]|uniref:Transcriptional regulator LysR family n=1 Tax=Methylorubrum populi TaxID=223967 RepID=A0A833J1I5_9HYPH|nr:LysR family transcriptional regulator [Methylorubrum populi]KAB7781907.1 Transcriptional regulator LysR family [Methylorubrum populi]